MKEGAKFSSLRSNLRVCWVMAEVAIATALLSLLAPTARANSVWEAVAFNELTQRTVDEEVGHE